MLHALLILLATTVTPGARCRPAAEQARSQLQLADRAMLRHNDRAANAALDTAVATLGDAYASPNMLDDTGMHLVLARSQQRQGRLRQAATLKRRILLERLQLCEAPPTQRGR